LYAAPVFAPAGTYNGVAVVLGSTLGTPAGVVGRIGIYNDNQGVPGALRAEYGTVALDASASAVKAITSLTITVAAGGEILWMAVALQGASTIRPTMTCISAQGFSVSGLFQYPLTSISDNQLGYIQDSVTGSLPNPMVPVSSTNVIPAVFLRA
jgi:hypothetical protein